MLTDEILREIVESVDGPNAEYKAILFTTLEGGSKGKSVFLGSSAVNDLAVMTVHERFIYFYIAAKYTRGFEVAEKMQLPYTSITKFSFTNLFMWTTLNIGYTSDGEKRKLKVVIFHKRRGLNNQKENLDIFLKYVKTKKLPR